MNGKLSAAEEKIVSTEKRLNASEEKIVSAEKRLNATEEKILSTESRLSAAERSGSWCAFKHSWTASSAVIYYDRMIHTEHD